MTYAIPKITITTREYLQRLAEHGNTVISPEVMTIQDVLMLYEQLDRLRDSLSDANEGARLLHSLATGGESELLKSWDLPSGTPEYKEAQQVADKFNFDTVTEQKF